MLSAFRMQNGEHLNFLRFPSFVYATYDIRSKLRLLLEHLSRLALKFHEYDPTSSNTSDQHQGEFICSNAKAPPSTSNYAKYKLVLGSQRMMENRRCHAMSSTRLQVSGVGALKMWIGKLLRRLKSLRESCYTSE